jgi:hypothetical protein
MRLESWNCSSGLAQPVFSAKPWSLKHNEPHKRLNLGTYGLAPTTKESSDNARNNRVRRSSNFRD